jgi:predicted dehydrogenase
MGPHLIDQALYLFGFPKAVYADIRTTRVQSLVDDWIDIVLYYPTLRVRLKAGFFCGSNSSLCVTRNKGFF